MLPSGRSVAPCFPSGRVGRILRAISNAALASTARDGKAFSTIVGSSRPIRCTGGVDDAQTELLEGIAQHRAALPSVRPTEAEDVRGAPLHGRAERVEPARTHMVHLRRLALRQRIGFADQENHGAAGRLAADSRELRSSILR